MAFAFATAARVGSPGTAVNSLTSAGVTSSGNFLCIAAAFSFALTPNTPTDSNANTRTAHPNNGQAIAGTAAKLYVWYALAATVGASHTFTCSLSAAATDAFSFAVIGLSSRAAASAVVSTAASAEATGVTSHTGAATGTLADVGDDVISAMGDNNYFTAGNNDTWTAGAGWTLNANAYTSDGRFQVLAGMQYAENVSSPGITSAFTSTSATRAAFLIMAVKSNGVVGSLNKGVPKQLNGGMQNLAGGMNS